MIVSRLDSPQISHRLEKILHLFAQKYSDQLPPGNYPLEGDDFFNVRDNETRPFEQCFFESHKDYTDVQLIIHGAEILAYRPLEPNETPTSQAGADCWLYKDSACDSICLTDGMFAVFFPGELHKPNVRLGNNSQSRKVILKLKDFYPGE